jgi:hypothetical protein
VAWNWSSAPSATPTGGPIVLVGLGGIWIEALHDVRLIPADMAEEDIVVELGRLKAAAVLHGIRGAAGVDLNAIAQVVALVGAQMNANPRITEIDINRWWPTRPVRSIRCWRWTRWSWPRLPEEPVA